jgi:hypothetical protein
VFLEFSALRQMNNLCIFNLGARFDSHRRHHSTLVHALCAAKHSFCKVAPKHFVVLSKQQMPSVNGERQNSVSVPISNKQRSITQTDLLMSNPKHLREYMVLSE